MVETKPTWFVLRFYISVRWEDLHRHTSF